MAAAPVATAARGRGRTRPRLAALRDPDAGIAILVAVAVGALAFGAQGGVALGRNTWSQVALVLAGGIAAAVAIAGPRRHARTQPLHGAWSLAGLAALTLLTAVSVVWSLAPADSWLDANRMFAYLAAFAGGIALVRLAPDRWPALLYGLALACVAVCGWALLTKVFPGALAPSETYARLRAPFGYWNSVGLMAALGIPPLLWLAARRSGHAALNALAYPALGLLAVCLMLSYSRGALLALAVGLVAWLALVPLRLRAAAALVAVGAASGAVVAWAFAQEGLTTDRLPVHVRADAGHELGVLLLLMTVVLLAAGLAIGFYSSYRPPSDRARRRAGQLLVGALVAVGLAGAVAVSLKPGGIPGQVSRTWSQLTDPAARTPANTPNRLTATASVRSRYWREAFQIHASSKTVGAGAAAYATARKRYRTGDLDVQHAHGWVPQTLADLGWIGLLVSLAAAAAWLAAAAVSLSLRRRDRGTPWTAERVGLFTLAAVVLVFVVHSLVDWTWYVPGNAVPALVAAGWVAGRGPASRREDADPAARWSLRTRLRAWHPDPYRTSVAAGVLVVAVIATWSILQPLRAQRAGDAAVAALQDGRPADAVRLASTGAERNPLSVEPLWELAAAQDAAGRTAQAHDALERAALLQPANPEAWRRLGRYRLDVLGDPEGAREALRAAYQLDPHTPGSVSDFLEVNRRLAPPGVTP